MTIDNQSAAYLRNLEMGVREKFALTQQKFDQLIDQNETMRRRLEQLERRDTVEDAVIGGARRIPYMQQINITVPQGAASALTGTATLTRSGPFIARRLYASFKIASVVDGGDADWVGRYLPLSSHQIYSNMFSWNQGGVGIERVVDSPLDFEWGYSDGGSDRQRQDRFISGDILARRDEDGIFAVDEVFASGATITFTLVPLRPVGGAAPWNDVQTGIEKFEFQVTFVGYRVV